MATKTFFSLDLTAGADTDAATIAAGKSAVLSVCFCNRNATPAAVRLAVCATASPAAGEYHFYDTEVPGRGSIEKAGIAVEAGKHVVVRTDVAGVSANGYGMEE